MAELTLKKIFEDLQIRNTVVEYLKKQEPVNFSLFRYLNIKKMVSKLIINSGFHFAGKTEEWIELVNEKRVEINEEIQLDYTDESIA